MFQRLVSTSNKTLRINIMVIIRLMVFSETFTVYSDTQTNPINKFHTQNRL
jgi:hypothetical protein